MGLYCLPFSPQKNPSIYKGFKGILCCFLATIAILLTSLALGSPAGWGEPCPLIRLEWV
jgi:hypothetical protein